MRNDEATLKAITRATAVGVVIVGTIVLSGWVTGIPAVTTLLPGWVSMKANTALCFEFAGIALFLQSGLRLEGLPQPATRFVIVLLGALIFSIAGLTGFEYLFRLDLRLDRLFFADGVPGPTNLYPGRMSPLTAANFCCVGLALFLLAQDRASSFVRFLGIVVAFVTLMVLTGTAYGLEPLHLNTHFTSVALHTNLCFSLLAAGILCATGPEGMMRLVVDRGGAGKILRQLLPIAVFLPMAVGWISSFFVHSKFWSPGLGVSIFSLSTIAAFTSTVWISAGFLYRSEFTSRQAAGELRHTLKRYTFLADNMPQIVWTARPDGNLDYYNQRWFEYSQSSLKEMEELGWPSFLHPDDVAHSLALWSQSVTTGGDYQVEFRLRRGIDREYRWHLGRASPMKDADGAVIQWTGTCTDIDDQRRAKEVLEKTVEERTARLQGLVEELETFSYSISHDLRAPLRAMVGFSQVLKEDFGPQLNEEANGYLNRIMAASQRMEELIKDVLSYSRVSRDQIILQPVDPRRVIIDVIQSYPHLSPNHIDVALPESMPRVLGNTSALTQCISNLLGNSAKFVPAGTTPKVEVTSQMKDGRVKIWFADNGIGIAPEHLGMIFEIFKRVNHTSDGTGIGLAIVRKAAEKMGGSVGVESVQGQGTTFWLELAAETRRP